MENLGAGARKVSFFFFPNPSLLPLKIADKLQEIGVKILSWILHHITNHPDHIQSPYIPSSLRLYAKSMSSPWSMFLNVDLLPRRHSRVDFIARNESFTLRYRIMSSYFSPFSNSFLNIRWFVKKVPEWLRFFPFFPVPLKNVRLRLRLGLVLSNVRYRPPQCDVTESGRWPFWAFWLVDS